MKNYTVVFILLFGASFAGGMALKNVYEYSMLIGVGLAMLFLFCSVIEESKRNNQQNSKKS